MARIEGVDLPRNKRVDIALTYIFGIGRKTAADICDKANVARDIKANDLSESEGPRFVPSFKTSTKSKVIFAKRSR